jgi:hypothetical protein
MAEVKKKVAAKRAAPRRKAAPSRPASGAPGFAVVGTGRSGTGYVAALLGAGGVTCGHEGWWRPEGTGERTPGLAGDASWLAVPDIESGVWSGPVAHVVRHPVATVRSLVGTRLFEPSEGVSEAYRQFALRHCPQVGDLPPLEAAVEWWVAWNERCAAVAAVKLRVEDLRTPWAVAELGAALGLRLDVRAVRRVSTTVNHRERGDVDHAGVWQLLDGRAARFGYRQ